MLIVSAHQGYPRLLNSGADLLEIDIRRTKDGVIVISHDEPRPGGEHATLDEVLQAARGRIGLQLDLKEAGYEVELIRSALERLLPEKLVVTTEMEDSIRLIKEQFPQMRAGLITQRVEPNHADFIALDQQYASDEALALAESDLDPTRGAILVRHGKGGKRREVGMDRWAGNNSRRGSHCALSCRSARCSAP